MNALVAATVVTVVLAVGWHAQRYCGRLVQAKRIPGILGLFFCLSLGFASGALIVLVLQLTGINL